MRPARGRRSSGSSGTSVTAASKTNRSRRWYINYLQGPPVSPFIVIRTAGDPALLAEPVRAEMRRIDKNIPLYDMRTMSRLRSEAISPHGASSC